VDANTALDYARSLRIMTDLSQRTTIATLYQVSESIYVLFDRVCVMDQGRCIYYGPRDQARQYFNDLGYYSPPRQTTADFVTAVTDINQVRYREGFEKSAPKTVDDRERAWFASSLYEKLQQEIEWYEAAVKQGELKEAERMRLKVRADKNTGVHKGSSFTVNFWEQVKACIYRQVLIKWGAREDYYVKLFTIVSVSLMMSSLFFKQPFDSSGTFTRGGIILFGCIFNGWLQLSEAYEAVAGRPMLARHKQFAFYRPSAVVVARAIVDIPLLALQCGTSSIIFVSCSFFVQDVVTFGDLPWLVSVQYFMANLRVNAGAYFIFLVFSFLVSVTGTVFFGRCPSLSIDAFLIFRAERLQSYCVISPLCRFLADVQRSDPILCLSS
jgi:ATP-binding cassette, subfamily G (WHITE), member 2, SNQ2